MIGFQELKVAIVSATGLSRDALHVYIGLAVFLLVALALRKTLRSWLPLAAVLAVAVGGELLDLRDDLVTYGHWRLGASMHDILNTTLWPAVLVLLARARWLRTGE